MTLHIEVSGELESTLKAQADQQGLTADRFAGRVLTGLLLPDNEGSLERTFHEHVERWKRETSHLSIIAKMIAHPSYLRIIGMGREGLPLVLKELRDRPAHWFVALNAITGQDPAPEGATFRQALDAWIEWGRDRGLC